MIPIPTEGRHFDRPLLPTGEDITPFSQILQQLQEAHGHDFSVYKPDSVMRRIRLRLESVGASSLEDYSAHLQEDRHECGELFRMMLVNVTAFFRDTDVWEFLKNVVLPRLIKARPSEAPLRVWSAGCASGEEAYTVLMMLAEVMGEDAVRERVTIHATDADEGALAEARRATYATACIAGVPALMLERYFDRSHGSYTVKRELRRSVVFQRHDLIQEAPIPAVDLLICRNTLMYFNADTQRRVLARFHLSMNSGGYLLVGRAELPLTTTELFTPLDLGHRLFRVASKTDHREQVSLPLSSPVWLRTHTADPSKAKDKDKTS